MSISTIIILAGHFALSNHPIIHPLTHSLSLSLLPTHSLLSLTHTHTFHAFAINAPSSPPTTNSLLHCFLSPLPVLKNTAGLTFLHAASISNEVNFICFSLYCSFRFFPSSLLLRTHFPSICSVFKLHSFQFCFFLSSS